MTIATKICRILAWSWLALVVLAIMALTISLNGFWMGMQKASLIIFSPLAMYYLPPTFILLGVSAWLQKAADADSEE